MTLLDLAHMLMTIDTADRRNRSVIRSKETQVARLSGMGDAHSNRCIATAKSAIRFGRRRDKDLAKARRKIEALLRARPIDIDDLVATVCWPKWLAAQRGKIVKP